MLAFRSPCPLHSRRSRSRWIPIAAVLAAGALLLAAPPHPAEACGPDFAIELLADRDETMFTLHEGFFLDEVRHLVPPPAVLPAGVIELGRDARVHYDRAGAGDTLHALHLYAQQAAVPGSSGATSLLFIARDLLADPARAAQLDEALAAPLGQRVFAIYLATRGDELDDGARDALWRRLTAIAGTGALAGAEHLATAAYRRGAWDDAARFAASAPDAPRARWVQAKLALRDADLAAADRHLAAAAAGLDAGPRARVTGERAALALAEGRVVDAMEHAWQIRDHYADAVHIAERVLTVEELIAFVERTAPDLVPAPERDHAWGELTPWLLRDLLGRRLMRAGRFDDARRYLSPDRVLTAWRYAAALARADRGDSIDRAAGYYDASMIARQDGLEILGTSHAPDWGLYHGAYEPDAWRASTDEPAPPRSRWSTPAEDDRVAAHAPSPDLRFHYRFIASDLAELAADLVPPQSQAFAVTLCRAARHVRHRDDARVEALYRRYIADGPAYGDMIFGEECPEPELERARRFLPQPPAPRWPYALVAAFGLAAAALLLRLLRPGRLAVRP